MPRAGSVSSAMRRVVARTSGGIDAGALGPAAEQALDAGDALVGAQVALEGVPGDPAALPEILEGVDDHLAQRARWGSRRGCPRRRGAPRARGAPRPRRRRGARW